MDRDDARTRKIRPNISQLVTKAPKQPIKLAQITSEDDDKISENHIGDVQFNNSSINHNFQSFTPDRRDPQFAFDDQATDRNILLRPFTSLVAKGLLFNEEEQKSPSVRKSMKSPTDTNSISVASEEDEVPGAPITTTTRLSLPPTKRRTSSLGNFKPLKVDRSVEQANSMNQKSSSSMQEVSTINRKNKVLGGLFDQKLTRSLSGRQIDQGGSATESSDIFSSGAQLTVEERRRSRIRKSQTDAATKVFEGLSLATGPIQVLANLLNTSQLITVHASDDNLEEESTQINTEARLRRSQRHYRVNIKEPHLGQHYSSESYMGNMLLQTGITVGAEKPSLALKSNCLQLLVKVWEIDTHTKRIEPLREYLLTNPIVSKGNANYQSTLEALNLTNDGELYFMREVPACKTIEFCVIDQDWPGSEGELPLRYTHRRPPSTLPTADIKPQTAMQVKAEKFMYQHGGFTMEQLVCHLGKASILNKGTQMVTYEAYTKAEVEDFTVEMAQSAAGKFAKCAIRVSRDQVGQLQPPLEIPIYLLQAEKYGVAQHLGVVHCDVQYIHTLSLCIRKSRTSEPDKFFILKRHALAEVNKSVQVYCMPDSQYANFKCLVTQIKDGEAVIHYEPLSGQLVFHVSSIDWALYFCIPDSAWVESRDERKSMLKSNELEAGTCACLFNDGDDFIAVKKPQVIQPEGSQPIRYLLEVYSLAQDKIIKTVKLQVPQKDVLFSFKDPLILRFMPRATSPDHSRADMLSNMRSHVKSRVNTAKATPQHGHAPTASVAYTHHDTLRPFKQLDLISINSSPSCFHSGDTGENFQLVTAASISRNDQKTNLWVCTKEFSYPLLNTEQVSVQFPFIARSAQDNRQIELVDFWTPLHPRITVQLPEKYTFKYFLEGSNELQREDNQVALNGHEALIPIMVSTNRMDRVAVLAIDYLQLRALYDRVSAQGLSMAEEIAELRASGAIRINWFTPKFALMDSMLNTEVVTAHLVSHRVKKKPEGQTGTLTQAQYFTVVLQSLSEVWALKLIRPAWPEELSINERVKLSDAELAPVVMVRDRANNLFYAQQEGSGYQVVLLQLDENNNFKRSNVFSRTDGRITGLEANSGYSDYYSSILLLDSSGSVYHIFRRTEKDSTECILVSAFDEVPTDIELQTWQRMGISEKLLSLPECDFALKSKIELPRDWFLSADWRVREMLVLPENQLAVYVCTHKKDFVKRQRFLVRPLSTKRRVELPHQVMKHVGEMAFISDQHVLLKVKAKSDGRYRPTIQSQAYSNPELLQESIEERSQQLARWTSPMWLTFNFETGFFTNVSNFFSIKPKERDSPGSDLKMLSADNANVGDSSRQILTFENQVSCRLHLMEFKTNERAAEYAQGLQEPESFTQLATFEYSSPFTMKDLSNLASLGPNFKDEDVLQTKAMDVPPVVLPNKGTPGGSVIRFVSVDDERHSKLPRVVYLYIQKSNDEKWKLLVKEVKNESQDGSPQWRQYAVLLLGFQHTGETIESMAIEQLAFVNGTIFAKQRATNTLIYALNPATVLQSASPQKMDPDSAQLIKLEPISEFKPFFPGEPVRMSKVIRPWIPKVEAKKDVSYKEECLQLSARSSAYLYDYNFAKGYAFELDIIDALSDFMAEQTFTPIGANHCTIQDEKLKRQVTVREAVLSPGQLFAYIRETKSSTSSTKGQKHKVCFSAPFKICSDYDLAIVNQLDSLVAAGQPLDLDTVTAALDPRFTVLSLFKDKLAILEAIQSCYSSLIDKTLDQDQDALDITPPIEARRLLRILSMPLQEEDGSRRPLISALIDERADPAVIEKLIEMATLAPSDFTLDTVLKSQDQLFKLLEMQTSASKHVLENAFTKTALTRELTKLNWGSRSKVLATFTAKSSLDFKRLAEQVLRAEGDENEHANVVPVEAKVMTLRWLYQHGKSFNDFIARLNQFDEMAIIQTEFFEVLFDRFYAEQRRLVIILGFCPFVLQLFCSLFFSFLISQTTYASFAIEKLEENRSMLFVVGVTILVLNSYFIMIEMVQMLGHRVEGRNLSCTDKVENYVTRNYFNVVDLVILVLSTILILQIEFTEIAQWGHIQVVGFYCLLAVNQVMMWIKMFEWIKMFPDLAIFNIMIVQVLSDVRPVLIVISFIMALFANAMYIMSAVSVFLADQELFSNLYEGPMSFFLSAFVKQFLLMVGDFDMDTLTVQSSYPFTAVAWMLFLGAILISQIIFLNLFIAIISDSFERVWESKRILSVYAMVEILDDWKPLTGRLTKKRPDEHLLFSVQRLVSGDGDPLGQWGGKLNKIKEVIASHQKTAHERMHQQKLELMQRIDHSERMLSATVGTVTDQLKLQQRRESGLMLKMFEDILRAVAAEKVAAHDQEVSFATREDREGREAHAVDRLATVVANRFDQLDVRIGGLERELTRVRGKLAEAGALTSKE